MPPINRGGTMGGNGNQMMDLMKANMLMNSKDNPIYTFIIMTILEVLMKYLNQLIEMGKKGQILFKNFKNPPQALCDLINNTPEEYFRFSYFDKSDENKEEKR